MVTWGGPTWEDYENEQRRLGLELPADTNPDNTDPHMELWVSRAALETVVRAASQRLSELAFPDAICKLEGALALIQEAVADAFEDPLDATPL